MNEGHGPHEHVRSKFLHRSHISIVKWFSTRGGASLGVVDSFQGGGGGQTLHQIDKFILLYLQATFCYALLTLLLRCHVSLAVKI